MTEADIPWALLAPFIVLYFILAVSALISCMKQEKTNGPKWMWILIIVGISFVGPVSYFIIGKKHMKGGVCDAVRQWLNKNVSAAPSCPKCQL